MEIQNNLERLAPGENPNTAFVIHTTESTICFSSPDAPLSNVGIYGLSNLLLSVTNTDPTGNLSFFKGDPPVPYHLAQFSGQFTLRKTDPAPWPRILVYTDPTIIDANTMVVYTVNNYSGNTITMGFNFGSVAINIQ